MKEQKTNEVKKVIIISNLILIVLKIIYELMKIIT